MLSLRHRTFGTSDRLCDAVNKHPYWQIVQIVSKDGYLELFYKTEDEDEITPVELAVLGLIEKEERQRT